MHRSSPSPKKSSTRQGFDMTDRAVLAIDEGTTGTRAALVASDGAVRHLQYQRLTVSSPAPRVVEQDAAEIWAKTLAVCQGVLRQARDDNIEIVGVAITSQRATAVLWDGASGCPLAPAAVWQDTRYADELAALDAEWGDDLLGRVGRRTGVRSSYLWAAHHLRETAAVADAHAAGTLKFGTIDTWLVWNLTGGDRHVTTATMACATGAYELEHHRYAEDYIDALGFPIPLLPELLDDADDFGWTSSAVLGIEVPILAVMGDQHAGIIGLGCLARGQAMCMHGTGSFIDLVTGSTVPPNPGAYEGPQSLVGWRRKGRSMFSVEGFTATTGSALDWICQSLGWFDSAIQISELAAGVRSANGIIFVPALTGLRMPVVDSKVSAVISGFTTASTRAELAYALLEGIAQSVADSLEGTTAVGGSEVQSVNVGGGLSGSDSLLQMQADLTGVTMRRLAHSETASLRGVAYLATSDGTFWDSLDGAFATTGPADVFEPAIGVTERSEYRARWQSRVAAELDLVN